MHQTNALLAALETDPHDADALLAALRTPPLEGKLANMWPDTRDSARTLVNAAREALANDFAEPHPLSAGRAVAFMVDTRAKSASAGSTARGSLACDHP
jgi:hypothetical protein